MIKTVVQPAQRSAVMMDDTGTRTIKGYELREQIGSGGFGAVYRAYQPVVGREVAIKIVLPEYADHPDFIRRFEAEAQVIARLEHPHIVPLYDYWREPGSAYLVMRWLRGGSLRAALKRGPLPREDLLRMLDQIAAALAKAHRSGVVHRDLKPDNILLDEEGNAYLADFGIAKDLSRPDAAGETQAGVVVGSPDYLSPEQVKGESVTPQSDIYNLGVTLYEVLAGERPFPDARTPTALLIKHLHDPLPSLKRRRADLPAAVDDVIQRATSKDPAKRYPDVSTLATEFRAAFRLDEPESRPKERVAVRQQLPTALTAGPTLVGVGEGIENPYKGLRAFQEADAADFFGRDDLIEQLLKCAADSSRFVAVVGPSGSGKSSAVRAGLLPALRRGRLPGSERWFIVEMHPGAHPLEELEAALLRIAVNPPSSLLEQLQADERGLLRAVRRVLPGDNAQLLLVIDQFEEVFTLVEDEAVRMRFLDNLLTAVHDPGGTLRVVITLRADFYDRPLLYEDFGNLVRKHTEAVLPLSAGELKQTICSPAERVGVEFEQALIDAIVKDVGEQPGTLPLLEYALTELFDRRSGSVVTLQAYRESGGVLGAAARRADELYNALDAGEQGAARQLFLRMVALGEGVEDTRRRVRRTELDAVGERSAVDAVLNLYARHRLLTFDRDPATRLPTVEVAHEALIRTWTRLRQWLDDSREDLLTQRRLTAAAAEWISAERDASFLTTGSRLDTFEAWAGETSLALSQEETDYLQSSIAERDARRALDRARKEREAALERRSRNRLRYLVAVLAVFSAVAIGLSAFAFNRQALAVSNASTAVANLTRSNALRLASEASSLVPGGTNNPELAGLLAIRALKSVYSRQADATLVQASRLMYTRKLLQGHTLWVVAVAFSPDGKTVLTGSGDNTARLWDAATGRQLRILSGHAAGVGSVAFSPDGNYLLTGSDDKTARLWDAKSGLSLRAFTGHTDYVRSVAFSPDGKYVLTGSFDNTARLWDAGTGQSVRTFVGHTDHITAVALSPDGRYALTGSDDMTARLWDVESGQSFRVFTGHTWRVVSVAFSPDGRYVLTGSYDRTARLWDAESGQTIRTFAGHTYGVNSAAFSADGQYVLTGSWDTTARLWDAESGQTIRILAGHTDGVLSVAFAPDGMSAVTGSYDGTARVWDTQTQRNLRTFVGPDTFVESAAFSPDGNYILTGSRDGMVRLWNIASGQNTHTLAGHTGIVGSVAFSPDGEYALTAGDDGTVRLWDIASGQNTRTLSGHEGPVRSAVFSPDGKLVLSASYDGSARLWDAQSGQSTRAFTGHNGPVWYAAFSPDGKSILTSGNDRTARLWDIQTGQSVRTFSGHEGPVRSAQFSPDGKYVLTGSDDKTARLWDVQTGQTIRTFSGHDGPIWSVAFSPDGKYALTGSLDKTARLWDADTGQNLRVLDGHIDAVRSVAFSPDGKYVLTGSWDTTARLWDTDYEDLIHYACTYIFRDFTDGERARYGIGDEEPTCTRFGQ